MFHCHSLSLSLRCNLCSEEMKVTEELKILRLSVKMLWLFCQCFSSTYISFINFVLVSFDCSYSLTVSSITMVMERLGKHFMRTFQILLCPILTVIRVKSWIGICIFLSLEIYTTTPNNDLCSSVR